MPIQGISGSEDSSENIIIRTEELLNRELNWIYNQIYEADEKLSQPIQSRRFWSEYHNALILNKNQLEGLKASLDSLKLELNESKEAAKDPELLELAQEYFAEIEKQVEEIYKNISTIARPTKPIDSNSLVISERRQGGLEKLRKLVEKATTSKARLIENPETRFPYSVAKAVDEAQLVMNDLYREQAEYGDGSCAFMVMKEQYEGGVGNEPVSLKRGTLHALKSRQYIAGLQKPREKLPPEARGRIDAEIKKMEEALKWAEDYRNNLDPDIPSWARPWKNQLGE